MGERKLEIWARKPQKKNEEHERKKMGITRPSPDGGVKRVANLWEDRKVRESGVPTVSR